MGRNEPNCMRVFAIKRRAGLVSLSKYKSPRCGGASMIILAIFAVPFGGCRCGLFPGGGKLNAHSV